MGKKKAARRPRPRYRFGIGEWYGQSFVQLTQDERVYFAEMQSEEKAERPFCPFLSTADLEMPCWKIGGVCSLRSYQEFEGDVDLDQRGSTLRVTCPSRFEESRTIYQWIGEVLIGTIDAIPVGQVNFLERVPLMGSGDDSVPEGEGVGRIDNVLIVPNTQPLQWCAVEIQGVYFSGDKMENDFNAILQHDDDSIPFPGGRRRPDYRSSGPKRLMPQLQIKVPTLRRWGKKMAVVVDEDFINNMGRMETVNDISNCDVAWFVVRFIEDEDGLTLTRGDVFFTELESAVNGLIAGRPVTQNQFEQRIVAKLQRSSSGPFEIPSDE